MSDAVHLYPLGGLGHVGMNCMLISRGDDAILVDCGVRFPDGRDGTELLRPDFSLLREVPASALVLTHGHEDHVGAIPFLLQRFPMPVFGPAYALELLKRRFARDYPNLPLDVEQVTPGQRFSAGPFELEPISVTHSIAGATALAIHTAQGTIVHSGDFKIDQNLHGEHFDRARLLQLGEAGVRLLLSDSTNALSPGRTGSERMVARALDASVADAPNRVVVCLFSSNTHRLRASLNAAKKHGRFVCAIGSSVQKHLDIAVGLGLIDDPTARIVDPSTAAELPRAKVLYLATGSQGERNAGLARLASGDHPAPLEAGDRAIMSSRIIPGNEPQVHRLLDQLLRIGVEVRTRVHDPNIHVSGHGYIEEQRELLALLRPTTFVPVHGTLQQLRAHADTARDLGVDDIQVVECGQSLALDSEGLRPLRRFEAGEIHVQAGFDVPETIRRERRMVVHRGIAFVSRGASVAVRAYGVCEDQEQLCSRAAAHLSALSADGQELSESLIKTVVRRTFARQCGWKPLVEVV